MHPVSIRLLCAFLLWIAPVLTSSEARGADVEIAIESMGIEGTFRPGGWTPVLLAMTSNLDDTASVLVSFEVPNSDGDIERYTRGVVLAPRQTVTRWVYPHLPPNASAQSAQQEIYQVRIYENDDGEPGRELASAPVSGISAQRVGTPAQMTEDLLLIVGMGNKLGLQPYGQPYTAQNAAGRSAFMLSQNERTIIVNAQPEDLPDRWQGLASFSTIVWGNGAPQALGLDEAAALREWIRRGGRLVIVLPESSDPWAIGSTGRTAFSDLLPSKAPTQLTDVTLESLMQAISKSNARLGSQETMSIRIFEADSIEDPWEPLAALPVAEATEPFTSPPPENPLDGGVYAIQRRLGFGWIVLVGIDASALNARRLMGQLDQNDGLPQADVFWNRLIGRRGTFPSREATSAYSDKDILRSGGIAYGLGMGTLVIDKIRIGGPSAGLGMLIALGIFIAYWILAGPASYAILRARGLVRHSWMAFVCIAGFFTVVALLAAWGGRSILQREAPIRHFTFLDVIDGEPDVRATSWFSAYFPNYGDVSVSIPGEENLLATWSAPPSGSLQRFPNTDVFQIANDSPNQFDIPSRATSTHFVAHWTGPLEGTWRELPEAAETPITQKVVSANAEEAFTLEGVIRHGLPWPLWNVKVGSISPFRNKLPTYVNFEGTSAESPIDALPNPGVIASLGQWPTGKAIDLNTLIGGPHRNKSPRRTGRRNTNSNDFSMTTWMNLQYEAPPTGVRARIRASMTPSQVWESVEAESIQMFATFNMLPQPIYLKNLPGDMQDAAPVHFQRWLGRETDCSDWFLRPCIMIFAVIENAPLPIPLQIDGEPVESSGTVVLRWIHPLPVVDRLVPPEPRTLSDFKVPATPSNG